MSGDAVGFSAMVGIGESFLPAFALALGHGDVTAGLVATLPMLAGAVLQLVTPAAVGILNSHRRWVVLCAALQAATFAPLISCALLGSMEVWFLYLIVALYWGFGMSTGPAWTAWVSTLVPPRIRPTYFASRARGAQVSLVVALMLGGVLLQQGDEESQGLAAYALIFSIALVARGISAAFLYRQSEYQPTAIGDTSIAPASVRRHIETGGHGRLLAYLLVFNGGVWIAAPYFVPYMFGPLDLSYLEFTVLTAVAFVARVAALPTLGRLARRWGIKRVLVVSSVCIIPLPILWLASNSMMWLLSLQVVSGFAWAAFELASLLAFFERIPAHGRASVLTVYNLANALSIVVGSAIGAVLIAVSSSPSQAFLLVFGVSTLARLCGFGLVRGVSPVGKVGELPPLRTLSVRPSSGGFQRPILVEPEAEFPDRMSNESSK